jgi:hypothetical protein
VVAVVNQITVTAPSVWDFRPAVVGLHALWHDLLYSLPFLACGLLIVLLAWGGARVATRGLRQLLQPRLAVALLREVLARAVGVLIFMLGLYIVLRIAGLTRLALTMLGAPACSAWSSALPSVTLPRTSWPVSY